MSACTKDSLPKKALRGPQSLRQKWKRVLAQQLQRNEKPQKIFPLTVDFLSVNSPFPPPPSQTHTFYEASWAFGKSRQPTRLQCLLS